MCMPFIVTGDFQCEPNDIEGTGLLSIVGAVIIAPEEGTCEPAGRTIDFFIVSGEFGMSKARVMPSSNRCNALLQLANGVIRLTYSMRDV